MNKTMLFAYNPVAGRGIVGERLQEILSIFQEQGYRTEVYISQKPGDLTEKIPQLGEGKELIVCSGGDGTLKEVVSGMMRMEQRPQLGYLPTGTTNDFGHSHDIPADLAEAARLVARGEGKWLDVGCLNQEDFFAYVAAFGAFTDIPYRTTQESKALLGHQAYLWKAVGELMKIRARRTLIVSDAFTGECEVLFGMITNSAQVGGLLSIPEVCYDDGYFEVLILERPDTLAALREVIRDFLHGRSNDYLHRFRAQSLELYFEEPVSWVLDGEYGGTLTQTELENHRKSIQLRKKPLYISDELK